MRASGFASPWQDLMASSAAAADAGPAPGRARLQNRTAIDQVSRFIIFLAQDGGRSIESPSRGRKRLVCRGDPSPARGVRDWNNGIVTTRRLPDARLAPHETAPPLAEPARVHRWLPWRGHLPPGLPAAVLFPRLGSPP